jgi:hypothetical protein
LELNSSDQRSFKFFLVAASALGFTIKERASTAAKAIMDWRQAPALPIILASNRYQTLIKYRPRMYLKGACIVL